MRGLTDSHHKSRVGLTFEDMGLLAVDIVGYITVSVLMGMLFVNVFGSIV